MLRTLVAHRGGRSLGPENSLQAAWASYELWRAHPASAFVQLGFEFDLQCSQDGHWVVLHDETLERTTNGLGRCCQFPLSELSRLLLRDSNHERLMDLNRFISQLPPSSLVLMEIKPSLDECQALLPLCLQYPEVTWISFQLPVLRALRQLGPQLQLGFLINQMSELEELTPQDVFQWWGPDARIYGSQLVEQASRANQKQGLKSGPDPGSGCQINPWTVNGQEDFLALIESGCTTVTTDRPQLLDLLIQSGSPL